MGQKFTQLVSSQLNNWYQQLANSIPSIITAFLVFSFFFALAKILEKYIYKTIGKFIEKKSLKRFSTSFVRFLIISIGLLTALSILNLNGAIASLLTGAGLSGLVIGFAMQEIISNYFSGITISVSDPFKLGELVEVAGKLGLIKKIKIRTTVIETPQGQIIEIPNKNVVNSPIINYSITGRRRIDISSGISYQDDPQKAKQLAIRVVSNIKGVDKNMPIEFFYNEFGKSALNFTLRFWMNFDNSQIKFFNLKSKVITKLLETYNKEGITMPYPTKTVRLKK